MLRRVLVLLALTGTPGCGGEGGVGEEQVSEFVSDTSLMRDASAAANGIIRNQADCEAVKANLPEVRQKLVGIEAQIQTATARTTLDSLRRQVRTIAEACGAR